MTNDELRDVIENEGLAYAIQDYLSPDSIEDIKTKSLWIKAKQALDELSKHLKLGEEEE